jgi:hypothetical protein
MILQNAVKVSWYPFTNTAITNADPMQQQEC